MIKLVICLSFEPACSLAASLLAVQTDNQYVDEATVQMEIISGAADQWGC